MVATKARGGMNREQFKQPEQLESRKPQNEDGEKEYVFDCTIMTKEEKPRADLDFEAFGAIK